MQRRLSAQLRNKIETFNVNEPYVWRLRLSASDFNELEAGIADIVTRQGVQQLATAANAIFTVIYLAEWYKRCYQGGCKNELTQGINLETLWENSGINQNRYLYHYDDGDKCLRYSLYVLGGLPIIHELNRNDKLKFLKGICRLYNQESYTIENIEEASRAVAFRESINRKHSLYEYLRVILSGEMPFNEDDLKDGLSDVNRFVATVKAANDEILKVKFRFEWRVQFAPELNGMQRKLIVWFKPEREGQDHQYLRYDRVHLWGIPHPEKQRMLKAYARIKRGDEVMIEKQLAIYLNHGHEDFVAFSAERNMVVTLPPYRFTSVDIIIKDAEGKEYLAQSTDATEFLQLWKSDDFSDWWSSTQNAQKPTSVLFSNRCQLAPESIHNEVFVRPFYDKKLGTGESWNWVYIYDFVSIINEAGDKVALFNRNGYDQVTTRLYCDTIRYASGGKIRHYYIDDPEVSELHDVEELPVIFGRNDVLIRHFATKDDILNAKPEEECQAEQVRYKQPNGFYADWTENEMPPYGNVTLQVLDKGKAYPLRAVYLPRFNEVLPIERNFDSCRINYRNFSNSEISVADEIKRDGKVLHPTLTLKYGDADEYYEVDVYRPTLIKEVLLDGELIQYLEDGEQLALPYIFKNRVQINDFSSEGYQAYECRHLRSIYCQDFINIAGNQNAGWAALAAWDKDKHYHGKLFDPNAPNCIALCFGLSKNVSDWESQHALIWNYDAACPPQNASPTDTVDFGLVFQDLSKNKDLICNYPIQMDDDPWALEDLIEAELSCFEVANDTGTYFFLMRPLIDLPKEEFVGKIYTPLLESKEGNFTLKEKKGLLRLSEEFGFKWEDYNIYLENA